ncbi:MAG: succinylglutamate desuccinylase/aspartoacylase family protein [Armatimonadota bacterium]|nr:succinylglutamate desuccinylase/aspartoacylase family protein [Armatimonadota bacterium]
MAGRFSIGDITVGPGEVGRGAVARFRLGDSQEVRVPAVVVNGREDGPTLLVTAGVHGREVCGIGALLDALKQMNPSQMSGRVIGVTVANPLAVQLGTYITPHDSINLSSPIYFPANARGTVTQRMAAGIEQAIEAADYVIDMHANPLPSMPFVLTCVSLAPDEKSKAEAKRFARAFGVTVIEMVKTTASSIRDFATQRGKPGITPELAGNHFLWDSITSVGTRGILNCAKAVGILPGEPEPQTGAEPILEGDYVFHGMLRSNAGGFLKVHRKPGEFIRAGDRVATILDCYGEVLEEIPMPVDGYCWAFLGGSLPQSWVITEGDSIAYVFRKQA